MLTGCARLSIQDQNPDLQLKALKQADCKKVFREKASGALRERPRLLAALDYMRNGDTLVVWKLDRLSRLRVVSQSMFGAGRSGWLSSSRHQ